MYSYLLIAAVVIITVFADYALKHASLSPLPYISAWFIVGTILYGATALAWVAVMQTHQLSQIAILYSAATIIGLTFIGIISFDESLSSRQVIGLATALLSVILTESNA